jgi:hypothetical protein
MKLTLWLPRITAWLVLPASLSAIRLADSAPLCYKAEAVAGTGLRVYWTDPFTTETRFRVQYRLEGTAAWSSVDVAANTTSHLLTGLIRGAAYDLRVLAFENSVQSKTQNPMRAVVLDVTDGPAHTTFEQWRQAQGLAGARRSVAGLAAADPDGDGQSNYWEYLQGTDPLAADAGGLRLARDANGALVLQWPHQPELLDASVSLQESSTLTGDWQASAWVEQPGATVATATLDRGDASRFYRLVGGATGSMLEPTSVISCWGDSLTAYDTNGKGYSTRLGVALGGRTTQNNGIGGDTSVQIMDRMRGLQIRAPYPASGTGTPPGTPLRIVAARTVHPRVMAASGSVRGTYAATIANVHRVEFLNRGRKIGESSTPLQALVTTNRAADPRRFHAPGHPFSYGDVVHFPAGPVPTPLLVGKTYYVRDVDADGFSLTEDDNFVSITASSSAPNSVFSCANHPFANGDEIIFPATPLPAPLIVGRRYYVRDAGSGVFSLAASAEGPPIVMSSNLSNMAVRGPVRAPLSLGGDLSAPTLLSGPFVLDWLHDGGDTDLSIRTHTDRDGHTFVFWLGRNNSSRPHEIYADVHAAVQQIKVLNSRFIIMGVLTASTETVGNPYYYNAINLNNLLAAEFPTEFIDIRGELIQRGQATGQDAIDRANDVVPSSLRSDTLHLNDAGYQVVADVLAEAFLQRGW